LRTKDIKATPEEVEAKQLGVKVDPALWKQMKILALSMDKTATELLHLAIAEYIERHKGVYPFSSRRTK
jgi:hypothetical protein